MRKRWLTVLVVAGIVASLGRPPTVTAAAAGQHRTRAPASTRRSASSSSARRTTSATTRPPTRARRRWRRRIPKLKVLTAENVPEDDNAARVMEDMIAEGAKIIFATSYGHLDPALKVAEAHPDVVVVQQGNFIEGTIPPNAGTYFGTVYEPVYLAGIAAGKATKTNKLGYVYAFPIPQTIANINAFELGAQSVNPDGADLRGQHLELV